MSDASRRQLLDQLFASNGQTLGEHCEHLDMTRQAVTKYLTVLEAANLIVTVWRGREKLARNWPFTRLDWEKEKTSESPLRSRAMLGTP